MSTSRYKRRDLHWNSALSVPSASEIDRAIRAFHRPLPKPKKHVKTKEDWAFEMGLEGAPKRADKK